MRGGFGVRIRWRRRRRRAGGVALRLGRCRGGLRGGRIVRGLWGAWEMLVRRWRAVEMKRSDIPSTMDTTPERHPVPDGEATG